MKKYFFLIIFFLIAFNQSGFTQTSDTTLNYLWSLNLDNYKNKPVDSFVAVIPGNYIRMRVAASGNPKVAEILAITYSNNVFIWIYVYDFQFMNPRSQTGTWDMSLFRKENVDHIELWRGWDCYNGCPDGAPSVAKPSRGKGN